MDYAHFGSRITGEVILSAIDGTGVLIPTLRITSDGRMFLNRAGTWKEIAVVEDIPPSQPNAVLTDLV